MTEDRPVYFTAQAWATLSPNQRELIRRGRMSRVKDLQVEHHARYHAPEALVDLVMATHPKD